MLRWHIRVENQDAVLSGIHDTRRGGDDTRHLSSQDCPSSAANLSGKILGQGVFHG